MPLLVSDLPVFLRWRGSLPFGERPLEELVGVTDRLVVDSREWDDPPGELSRFADYADRVAVSDIAWARVEPWRRAIADLWPDVAEASSLGVTGPAAESTLLARWLGARLGRAIELSREPADEVEAVEVDGRPVDRPRVEQQSPSDLLSAQLDTFGRDPIYEEALGAVAIAAA
jgi:glucose-6-phosphate dehydrogenase assembly protein OpcA